MAKNTTAKNTTAKNTTAKNTTAIIEDIKDIMFFLWLVWQSIALHFKKRSFLRVIDDYVVPYDVSIYTDRSYGADADGNRGISVDFIESFSIDIEEAYRLNAYNSFVNEEVFHVVSVYDDEYGIEEEVDIPFELPEDQMTKIIWWASLWGTDSLFGIYWEELLFMVQYQNHEDNKWEWTMKVDY